MKRDQQYLDGYTNGLELGYNLGYNVASSSRVRKELSDLARPVLRLVHSQPAGACTRSRRARPRLALVRTALEVTP